MISMSNMELDCYKKSEVNTNCQVCNESINAYMSYGAMVCASCRVFFRRHAHKESKKCSASGHCDITLIKRTFCNYCRFQKCLRVGMDPKRIKKRKIENNQTKRKTLKSVIEILAFIPESTHIRPFLPLTTLRNWHSGISFTHEEFLYLQTFQKVEYLAWKSIPFPKLYFDKIFVKNQTLSAKGFEELKQNSFERLIKFSNDLDLLQALPLEDQFVLQTINLKFLDWIRLADLFQPLYTKNQQVNLILNGCPKNEGNFHGSKIDMDQIFQFEDPIKHLITSINDLQMDHLTLLLVTIILLFNVPDKGTLFEKYRKMSHLHYFVYS